MTEAPDARRENRVALKQELRAEEPCSNPWKRATYALGVIVLVLLGILLWSARTAPTPAVGLYNDWMQWTRLMAQPGRPLRLLNGDSMAAGGITEAGTQMLGPPASMQWRVARDLNVIAGGLSGVLDVMRERGKDDPRSVGPSLRAFRPTYGPSANQFIDLDWLDPHRGWALVGAVCGHSRCPSVYATRNGGRTWSRLASPRSARTLTGSCERLKTCIHALQFVTPRIGYLYAPALFMTTDGGRVWTHVPAPPVESIAYSGSEVYRLVYHSSGCPGPCRPSLQRSTPGGRTWTTLPRWHNDSQGFGEQLLASGADLYTVFYGHTAGGGGSAHATIELSHDRGRTWVVRGDPCGYSNGHEEDAVPPPLPPGPGGHSGGVAAADNSIGVLCVSRDGRGPNFTELSRDGGRRFEPSVPLTINAPEQIGIDGGSGVAVGNGGITGAGRFDYELALSRDGGKIWHIVIHDQQQIAGNLTEGSLQFVSPRVLSWVGYPYSVYRSLDGGQTWHRTAAP